MSKTFWPSAAWVILLAVFFAQAEIQIEGAQGWAADLPTWRIEQHWLLDIFWGGRPMTGYHAWVFPFIALFFHFPAIWSGHWDWRIECRIIASIMLFWIVEDFCWFVLNPAFGLERFAPQHIPWHKSWLLGAPIDYWIYALALLILLWISRPPQRRARSRFEGAGLKPAP